MEKTGAEILSGFLSGIINSKNFNRIMYAATVALGVGWYLDHSQYWLIVGFIFAASYSAFTLVAKFIKYIKNKIDEDKLVSRGEARANQQRSQSYAKADLLFRALSDENKRRLADIVIQGENGIYDNCFIFRQGELFHNHYVLQNLMEATAYGGENDLFYTKALVTYEERDNATIVVIDPDLLQIVRQYINDNNITKYEQQD